MRNFAKNSSLRPPGASDRLETKVRPVHLELLVKQLLQHLRIAVIYGGDRREPGAVIREGSSPRSWKSYQSVARDIADALGRLGAGNVTLLPDDMRLAQRLQDEGIQLAWLNTAGVQGYGCCSAHAFTAGNGRCRLRRP